MHPILVILLHEGLDAAVAVQILQYILKLGAIAR